MINKYFCIIPVLSIMLFYFCVSLCFCVMHLKDWENGFFISSIAVKLKITLELILCFLACFFSYYIPIDDIWRKINSCKCREGWRLFIFWWIFILSWLEVAIVFLFFFFRICWVKEGSVTEQNAMFQIVKIPFDYSSKSLHMQL
jgi:hypothetical protein